MPPSPPNSELLVAALDDLEPEAEDGGLIGGRPGPLRRSDALEERDEGDAFWAAQCGSTSYIWFSSSHGARFFSCGAAEPDSCRGERERSEAGHGGGGPNYHIISQTCSTTPIKVKPAAKLSTSRTCPTTPIKTSLQK